MVTSAGFNALLKVVEEPPPHVKFVFATTEPEKVIGTIRSRTHHYPFRLVPPARLQDYLGELCEREGVEVAKGVLPLVVRAGGGSVRDALSVLDQLIAGSAEEGVTYERAVSLLGYTDATLLDAVVDAFAAGDAATVFKVVDRVIESGHEPRRFVEDLLERLRDLLVVSAVPDGAGVDPARPAGGPARADARPGHPVRRVAAVARGGRRQQRADRADRGDRAAAAARAALRAGAAAGRRRRGRLRRPAGPDRAPAVGRGACRPRAHRAAAGCAVPRRRLQPLRRRPPSPRRAARPRRAPSRCRRSRSPSPPSSTSPQPSRAPSRRSQRAGGRRGAAGARSRRRARACAPARPARWTSRRSGTPGRTSRRSSSA